MDEIIQEIIRIIEDIAEIPADEISADSHIIDDLELMLIQTVSDLASLINEKRR